MSETAFIELSSALLLPHPVFCETELVVLRLKIPRERALLMDYKANLLYHGPETLGDLQTIMHFQDLD